MQESISKPNRASAEIYKCKNIKDRTFVKIELINMRQARDKEKSKNPT